MMPSTDSGAAATGTRQKSRTRAGRFAWIALAAVALIGSIVLLRSTSLHGLPRIPDPFEAYKDSVLPLAESENAFTFYRRAFDRYVDAANGSRTIAFTDPSQITPGLLTHLEANRESLGLWFEGTKRERGAFIVDTAHARGEIILDVTNKLRNRFSQLANLQAFQLQNQGDYNGSWTWVRANLRSSRHAAMSGFLAEKAIGYQIYQYATDQAIRWADDPKVDAMQLRQALSDVLVINELTTPASRIVLYECVTALNTLDNPVLREQSLTSIAPPSSWKDRIKHRLLVAHGMLTNEPERSRRVIRLIAANWLSACDQPTAERRRRAVRPGRLTLYTSGPGETPAIGPADLELWYQSTSYAKVYDTVWPLFETILVRDEQARASLVVHLAEQLYKREQGREPSSVEELVGPYLKALPDGYVAPSNPPGPPK
jgi:hypothetical protein